MKPRYNHSIINDFIINYKEFPLSKKYKTLKIKLIAGQYLFIPSNWTHWVFTEPNSISISYSINKMDINYNDDENKLFNSIIQKKPFIGKCNKYQINYDDYLKDNKNKIFKYVKSDNKEVSPVDKQYVTQNKYFCNDKLDYIINNFKDKYKYISHDIDNNEESNKYDIPNFNNILNSIKFNTEISIWINFDKKIDSGNHYDECDNIIYLLTGEKTIYLSPPGFNKYLYFSTMKLIDEK
jgi:hypothetical protein